ncbi:MAG TPA: hypothetical protein VFR70_05240 [Flavobacterium sp.]|nr:hypothetical protein [Flavobacterium sp.]
MDLDRKIRLRTKFEQFSSKTIDEIKSSYAALKTAQAEDFKFEDAGNHIWLGIGLFRRAYWSPSLHLELRNHEKGRTFIRGTFGPDPILWLVLTGFRFLAGGLLIIFAIISYSKWSSHSILPKFDLLAVFILANAWLLLYAIAKLNRKKGADQMRELLYIVNKMIQ